VSPRKYHQEKRSATAEETRQRIVDATVALHAEKGIVATSVKDIAARADVGVGTVYHHFPTYDDVVRACGPRILEITHAPTLEIFAGVEGPDQRIERLVHELFAYYERYYWFERARCDQDTLPVLAEGVARRDKAIEALVREALRPLGDNETIVRTVIALTDFAVRRSLVNSGFSTRSAAEQVIEVLLAWLASMQNTLPS
jgi:AcrR family transcriptional regulator